MQGKTHKALGYCTGAAMVAYDLQHEVNVMSIGAAVLLSLSKVVIAQGLKKCTGKDGLKALTKDKQSGTLVLVGSIMMLISALLVCNAIKEGHVLWSLGLLTAPMGAMAPDMDHHATQAGRAKTKVVGMLNKSAIVLAVVATLYVLGVSLVQQTVTMSVITVAIGWVIFLVVKFVFSQPKVQKAMGFYKKHRGIMHTLLVPVLVVVLCIVSSADRLVFPLALGFALGYISHILADMCTVMGSPVLWPISQACISLLPIKTGTSWETIVAIILGGLIVWFGAVI